MALKTLPPVIVAPVAPVFVTLQVIVWNVAFVGTTVPVNVRGTPVVAAVGIFAILSTGMIPVVNEAGALGGEAK